MFAEIVDASALAVDEIRTRALRIREAGADVVDLGCLPDTPFPHLEDAVGELKRAGLSVSVDSGNVEELRRGGRAGAEFLLSLTGKTLHIAAETRASPVLVPRGRRALPSLLRGAE